MKRISGERSGLRSNVALAAGCAAVFLLGATASQSQENPPKVSNPTTAAPTAAATHIPVTFSGGHETDPRDRGRPVVLVAGALGVTPAVFREAFSHVHPANAGQGQGPSREQAQQNKAALMDALGKYGVTNDRLDEVSNYYRYVRSRGDHWPSTPAEAYAVVEKGVITGYVVTSGGSGYSSSPTISVAGFPDATVKVQLAFAKDFRKNGAIAAITPASTNPTK